MTRTLVWFREHDLRVADHAPLCDALAAGQVIPVFVIEPASLGPEAARRRPRRVQFLLQSLRALEGELRDRGSRLVLISGPSVTALPALVQAWQVDRVVAHAATPPDDRARETALRAALGPRLALYDGETLVAPGSLRTSSGAPYSIFTAFARAWRGALAAGKPLAAPRAIPAIAAGLGETHAVIPTLSSLGLSENPALLVGGEAAAERRLRRFLRSRLHAYAAQRDRLDVEGTSRLSADIAVGTISVRRVWCAVQRAGGEGDGARAFQNELIWREFAYSTLRDRPDVLKRPFRPAFAGFPWASDEVAWRAWVEGRTGYPVVDAAARQLLSEGFVPNRARMIAASFLTKHLLLDFRRGEAHYLEQLTDGDIANNDAAWQWSAGCGCDAQPYYRVFSPVLQGERFDPEGTYVRRWVPELSRMPARFIHRPWEAPLAVLREARLTLDVSYPRPIVAHRFVRERFIAIAKRHLAKVAAAAD